MELPTNVRIKSGLWNIIPLLSTQTAQAIYPNIYVPKWFYEHLKSKNPNPKRVAILVHEQTHIERQRQVGWLLWELKYLLLPKFRFNEELEAIKTQVEFLKSKGIEYDKSEIQRFAKFLSSYIYLWMINYEEAKMQLERI